MQVDPAAFEICGHIVLKRSQDYETVTQVCMLISVGHCFFLLWTSCSASSWHVKRPDSCLAQHFTCSHTLSTCSGSLPGHVIGRY